MTRPFAAAQRFVNEMPAELRARIVPLFSPLLEIVPMHDAATIAANTATIFTSSNGVAYGPEGAGRTAFCVGAATTERAIARGWAAQMVGQDAEALVNVLATTPATKPLVHIRGWHTRGDIAARLRRSGHSVEEVIAYDQVLQPLNEQARRALAGDQTVIVPLFSPRTATQFAKEVQQTTSLHVVALSSAVAAAAHPAEVNVIAARPDAHAMYDAIRQTVGAG